MNPNNQNMQNMQNNITQFVNSQLQTIRDIIANTSGSPSQTVIDLQNLLNQLSSTAGTIQTNSTYIEIIDDIFQEFKAGELVDFSGRPVVYDKKGIPRALDGGHVYDAVSGEDITAAGKVTSRGERQVESGKKIISGIIGAGKNVVNNISQWAQNTLDKSNNTDQQQQDERDSTSSLENKAEEIINQSATNINTIAKTQYGNNMDDATAKKELIDKEIIPLIKNIINMYDQQKIKVLKQNYNANKKILDDCIADLAEVNSVENINQLNVLRPERNSIENEYMAIEQNPSDDDEAKLTDLNNRLSQVVNKAKAALGRTN